MYFALGSAVWLIYTLDHLNDARKLRNPTSFRHSIHKTYSSTLIKLVLITVALATINLFWLPREVLFWGFTLGFFSMFYLKISSILGKKGIKEILIAIIYAGGIFLYPLITMPLTLQIVWEIISLLLLAFVNLCLISMFEKNEDKNNGFPSIASLLSSRLLIRVIYSILIALTCLVLSASVLGFDFGYTMFVAVGISIYTMIIWKKDYIENGWYRYLSDAVFLVPLVL